MQIQLQWFCPRYSGIYDTLYQEAIIAYSSRDTGKSKHRTDRPGPVSRKPVTALPEHAYCVIMAGGKGERFWPLSTGKVPKPFLKLTGDKTLIQHTVERVLRIVPKERILIVIGKPHLGIAQKQLPLLSEDNFIVEPVGKDTAPCIGLAAVHLLIRDAAASMIVLPADQYVPDEDKFADTAKDCLKLAHEGDHLITLGITPSRPETGYGYILARTPFVARADIGSFTVDKFVEKPDLQRAVEYVKEGHYYWNAGIFVWRAETVLDGMRLHMPGLYEGLQTIEKALRAGKLKKADLLFKGLERKSIDYGLMEKATNVLMVPAKFKWDDVGTWASLERVLDLGEKDNYVQGNVISIDTRRCVVIGDSTQVIGTIGVSDLVIVASKKGILLCDKKRVQDVREVVKLLEKKKE